MHQMFTFILLIAHGPF